MTPFGDLCLSYRGQEANGTALPQRLRWGMANENHLSRCELEQSSLVVIVAVSLAGAGTPVAFWSRMAPQTNLPLHLSYEM